MENVNFEIRGGPTAGPLTVAQALVKGTEALSRIGMEGARLDAELLLRLALGWGREQLILNNEKMLETTDQTLFLSLLERRACGEPLAYITGHREFWSLDFIVTPAVLSPRPETERIVEVTLSLLEELDRRRGIAEPEKKISILELGTGSGAIAVSLAKERKDLEIWATDLSPAALAIARGNAERHGVEKNILFFLGDTFEPVKNWQGSFHGIISNPPYVRLSEMETLPREVLREPRLALDGGSDGLDLYRRIIPQGHLYLVDEGFMALEMGLDMGQDLSRLFGSVGCYSEVSVHQDYSGRDRVISACLHGPNRKPDRKG